MIDIIKIPVLSDNYTYLIIDKKSKVSACIDPAVFLDVQKVLEARNIRPNFILNTHHHSDHIGGNIELKKKHDCKIIGNFFDKERIPGIDIQLKENDIFKIGESSFTVIETSGHTIGHICFYFNERKILFSGDTLFYAGCGRLFEGTPEDMLFSMDRYKELPSDTLVYCGHEYTESNLKFAMTVEPHNEEILKALKEVQKSRSINKPSLPSRIDIELKINPFMRCRESSVIEAAEKYSKRKLGNTAEILGEIRNWKDNF